MVNYKCHNCGHIFDRKSNLDNHLARKKACNKQSGSKTNKKVFDPTCKGCGRTFSRRDSLKRHMNNCKGNNKKTNQNVKGKKIINGNKNKQIKIKADNSSTVNNILDNHINVVNLYVFGKDGIKNLTSEELFKMLRSNNNCYESLISMVNFNPDKPQHHNVYYPDMKSSYGVIYENNKWITKKIEEILNLILDAKTEDLNEIINEFGDCLNKKTRIKIKNAIENADYSKPDCRKKLISYLKPILFNNKNMIIKTRKNFETDQNVPFLNGTQIKKNIARKKID